MFEPGSFFEDEVLTITGLVEQCHFYRCHLLIKGEALISDCILGDMEPTDIECIGSGVVFSGCLFVPKGPNHSNPSSPASPHP